MTFLKTSNSNALVTLVKTEQEGKYFRYARIWSCCVGRTDGRTDGRRQHIMRPAGCCHLIDWLSSGLRSVAVEILIAKSQKTRTL